ncbi:uncharacterized protein METZ01_LOCUS85158 [marine metagenome]|uniref:Uncharacterized protein n=1 Tax=marine metagenome TaxID=408172 RepID=A0A381UWI8_9ZZZZ
MNCCTSQCVAGCRIQQHQEKQNNQELDQNNRPSSHQHKAQDDSCGSDCVGDTCGMHAGKNIRHAQQTDAAHQNKQYTEEKQ